MDGKQDVLNGKVEHEESGGSSSSSSSSASEPDQDEVYVRGPPSDSDERGQSILAMALDRAVVKFEDTQTTMLVKNEYDEAVTPLSTTVLIDVIDTKSLMIAIFRRTTLATLPMKTMIMNWFEVFGTTLMAWEGLDGIMNMNLGLAGDMHRDYTLLAMAQSIFEDLDNLPFYPYVHD